MTAIDTILDKSLLGFTRLGVFARAIDVIEAFPGISGAHVMVTGATGGIGRATARRLAANGAVVHAVGRSRAKLEELAADTTGSVVTHQADLSNMEAIEHLASEFKAEKYRLDGIVNNVGVMTQERIVTSEGFELSYAQNLLGHYVLVMNLLPALVACEPSRIVMVSSGGMYSQPLSVGNIESIEGEYDGTAAYARTKRGQVVLAEHWARAFAADGIRVNSMHPGWVDTEGVRDALPTFRRFTLPLLRNEEQGADSIVWLIASGDSESHTGQFIHDRKPRETHRMNRTKISNDTSDDLIAKLAADAAPYLAENPEEPEEVDDATNH